MNLYDKKSFTLIELLIVIGILAILVAAVFIVLNPFEYLKQSRDSKRITDLASLDKALAFMEAQGATSFGDSNVIYVSIPDTSETCNNLGFDTVDGWTYHCVTPSNLTNIDGTGWVPVNFNSSGIAPISKLPIDPVNNTSTGLYYTYVAGSYELTALLESVKYQQRIAAMDGGDSPVIYERGSHIGVTPRIVGPSGYSHKRTITINNATSTLTDFQVDVPLDTATLIAANKMNSDCSDIR
ncbi:MAG: type II secretion system protein, partial [Candidatus Pacebacteria bacterium]|nr:type II secretion system protein [Candidatus Paceibacterota bacterium]